VLCVVGRVLLKSFEWVLQVIHAYLCKLQNNLEAHLQYEPLTVDVCLALSRTRM